MANEAKYPKECGPGNDMKVDGNVGVGTPGPASQLHVYGGASGRGWSPDGYDRLLVEHSDHARIDIITPNTKHGVVAFSDGDAFAQGAIRYQHDQGVMDFTVGGSWLMTMKNGNVGIGTRGPAEQLELYKSGGGAVARIHNPGVAEYKIGIGSGTSQLRIMNTNGNTALQNETRGIAIDTSGNVGIGTTDPGDYKLKVEGGNAVVNNTFMGDVAHGPTWAGFSHMHSADSIGYALLQNDTGQYTLINKRSGPGHIGFRIDNADKMVLTNDGNVGIGTTSPSAALEVANGKIVQSYNDLADFYAIGLRRSGAGGLLDSPDLSGGGTLTLAGASSGGGVVAISGDVGIGTTEPGAKLEVSGGDARFDNTQGILLENNSGGIGGRLKVNSGNAVIIDNGAGDEIRIETNNDVSLVSRGGNVGIGTTSPDEKLHVIGNILLEGSKEIKGISNGIMLGRKGWERMGFAQDFAGNRYEQVFWGAGVRISASSADPRGENNVAAGDLIVEGVIHAKQGVMFPGGLQTTAASNGGGAPTLWAPSGSDIYYNAGNVGIGTTPSPGAKLDVQEGHIRTSGAVLWNNGTSRLAADQGGSIKLGDSTTTGTPYIDFHYGVGGDYNMRIINSGDKQLTIMGGDIIVAQGDIKLTGGDCAEYFAVEEPQQIEPGTVLVIDQEDRLRQSDQAYDKRVVGVVSGAGGLRPGVILGQELAGQQDGIPVALTGKVYCKVDAQDAPIEVGDLLTTSPTPGHAMKADDPLKAFGAVIGKALRPLRKGQGLIPIMVALQ